MPLPLGPIIAAGASLVGQGINAAAQGSMNRKTRKWSEQMYSRQRADSLADWNMMNEYNHPSAQMERLRKAGLSPHLVYGNGADVTASPVRSSDTPSWSPKAPEFDLGSSVGAYFNTQNASAVNDNLRAQNTVLAQEGMLKAAQTVLALASAKKTGVDTATSEFDLTMKNLLKDISLQAADVGLRNQIKDLEVKGANIDQAKASTANIGAQMNRTNVETDLAKNRDLRESLLAAQNIQESMARIISMRFQNAKTEADRMRVLEDIKGLESENIIKRIDAELKKQGVDPRDPFYWRKAQHLMRQFKSNTLVGEWLQKIDQLLRWRPK